MSIDVQETVAGCRGPPRCGAGPPGRSVGLVPTMGALHAGHVSLIARARAECDVVAVSIFVNPLQFGDPEDIANVPAHARARPRRVRRGRRRRRVRAPRPEMYPSWPEPPATTVSVRGVSDAWEGASRPGHFDGVATVVAKLSPSPGPCRAYFGLKDFQQLAVVRAHGARPLACRSRWWGARSSASPTAWRSRAATSGSPRPSAPPPLALSRALAAGRAAVAAGERAGAALARGHARRRRRPSPWSQLDYAVAVDAATLEPVEAIDDPAAVRLLIAALVGPVRLIDNCAAFEDADTGQTDDPTAHDQTDAAVPARTHRQLERIG